MLDDDLGSFKFDNEKLFNCNTPIIDNKYLLLCCVSDNFEKIYELKEYTCYQFILENDGDNDTRYGVWANGLLVETSSKNFFIEKKYISS